MKNKLSKANSGLQILIEVEEERELPTKRRIKRFFSEGNQKPAQRNMKLKFMNKISQEIFTGDVIKGEGDTRIEVALVDDPTDNLVDLGPEASARVGIFLLKGQVEEFDEDIVPEIEGKLNLLNGNLTLKLHQGIAVLENVRFRHHASKLSLSEFKLGARFIDSFDGVYVKEAKTESFKLKDYRSKYYKKHEIPSLSDEVSRLVNIRLGGKIDKRLRAKQICTVEDFLIQLLINPDELKSIVKLGRKKWEAAVKNARACSCEERMYCYENHDQKKAVVFNIFGQVLRLYYEGQCVQTSMLSQKDIMVEGQKLFMDACQNWGDVKVFNELNTKASELGEESFHSVTQDFDSTSFGIDVEIMHETAISSSSSPLHFDTMFPDFDDYLRENESEVVRLHTSNPPRRWRILFCVWLSIRKMLSRDVAPKF